MGIEPFLLASSLLGVLAQRLVRRLCVHCKLPDPSGIGMHAPGCAHCAGTGYSGRTGIYELLVVDDPIRALIHAGAPDTEVRQAAEAGGMVVMRADARRWLDTGVTSQEEILRVTRD